MESESSAGCVVTQRSVQWILTVWLSASAVPLVSPVLAGMCMLKEQMKKTGQKSQKFNQPCLQTLMTVTAIVIVTTLVCSPAGADKDMKESSEDKDKAQTAPKFMEAIAGFQVV